MSGFGGTIKLTGEKDYLNALKRIRQSLRETASSLSAISSSFKDNTRDMDNTRKAAGKLRDILKKQSDDANNLRSSYEKMQKIFENNRRELEKLQKAYENANKELKIIEKEVGKSSDAYKKQAEEVKKLEQNLEKETKKQHDNEIALSKMRTELNNAEAALHKTRGELEKTATAISNNAEAAKKAESAYGKLKTVIGTQEKELRKLKDEYKEIILKEGNASEAAKKLADQIQNLTGKLEENKAKLKNVDDAAEKVADGLKHVGENAKESSNKFEVFKTALGNFISNIVIKAIDKLKELALETLNIGMAFDRSMARVAAISGATGSELQALRDKAKDLGRNTVFTARETADAMNYMAIAGWKPQEILEGIAGVLALAAASGSDLALTSDILTDALTAFRKPASDAGRLADIMAAAAANSNTNVDKMGETFKYVAPIAGALGYSMEDTAIAIGAIADSGIKASQAGTDLRSIFSRLASNTGASKNQLGALGILTEKLGVEFYDASGKTRPFIDVLTDARKAWKRLSEEEQVSYAKTIAGKNAMSGWLALMNTAPEKFNQITNSIKNSNGAAQRMAEIMLDNTAGDITRLSSKFEGLQLTLYEKFEPAIRGTINILENLVDAIQFVAKHSTEFSTAFITMGTAVGTFLAITQGPAILSGLSAAIEGIIGAITALGAVIVANPIGAIIAAVAALTAGFIYLWNTSEEFRNFWIGMWESIKNAVEPVIKFITEWFTKTWNKVKEIWEPVGKFFIDLFNLIAEAAIPIAYSIGNAFKEAWELIKVVWDYVAPYFKGLFEGLRLIFSAVVKIIALPFKNAWELIKLYWGVAVDFFKAIWGSIKAIFDGVKSVLIGAFKLAWEGIKAIWNVVTGYFKAIWDTIAKIFSVVKSVLTGDFKGAWEGIKGIVSTWAGFFRTVWENIKNVFSAVKEFFRTTFSAAWTAVKGVFSNWVGFFRSLWERIRNTFSNIGSNIANAIGGAVKRGINGIISMIEGTINTAINIINGAIRLINMIPGVEIGGIGYLSLPRLAKGGVLDNGARTVIAGEDGAEAIVPLEKNTKWISLVANQLQKQMMPSLNSGANVQSSIRVQDEFNSLTNSFKQALSEMKVVMDEETFGKFIDRTVSDSIYGMEA